MKSVLLVSLGKKKDARMHFNRRTTWSYSGTVGRETGPGAAVDSRCCVLVSSFDLSP